MKTNGGLPCGKLYMILGIPQGSESYETIKKKRLVINNITENKNGNCRISQDRRMQV
jgi:hypothetical protein